MSTELLVPPATSPPPTPARLARVEYLDFQNVDEHREFRFRVYGTEGSAEFRLRIAFAAVAARRVRLQDGPDVCYQKLLSALAAGETASPAAITIDDADLASYVFAHTKVVKHRSSWTPSPPKPAVADLPRRRPRDPSPPRTLAPPVASTGEPGLEEGQRVRHAVFGVGVTTSSGGGHTAVRFDQAGPKTFVTSMLALDVLSAPHTWETSPRGTNRPCRTLPAVG